MTQQTGDGDVIDVLLAQHARIEDLFAATLNSRGDERRERFDELVRLLAVHETAEEEIVHPYAQVTIDSGPAVVADRLAEERRAKQMLAELYENGTDTTDFDRRLIALRDAVLTHAKHEERYEFTYLRAAVDPEQLHAMAATVLAAEALAPTRPHPGIESAAANLVLGPPLATVDRARDLMRARRGGGSE
ncbi:hemerythrin domain-containing protein [Micromonospora sp. NPDC052213]|uniref:hemerythrin domain-containing protein n=1 Tax=Micromonospora sp. NPDC052213 TaxID=3155812 RepID=UPI00341886F4